MLNVTDSFNTHALQSLHIFNQYMRRYAVFENSFFIVCFVRFVTHRQ